MKTKSNATPLRNWSGIIAASILILLLFGCTNQKKVTKWNDSHPLQAAEYAEKKFPCKPGDTTMISSNVDDSAYNNSVREMNESLDSLNSANDELLYKLMHTDTACKQYLSVIKYQKYKISDLQFKLANIEPKIITKDHVVTVIDSSKAVATRLANGKLQASIDGQAKTISNNEKEIAEWKSTARIRLWMLISSGLVTVLLGFFLFKKKANPISKLENLV